MPMPAWSIGCAVLAIVALCVCAACAAPASAGETSGAALPIPRLEHSDAAYHLMVDGNPFLILGGQALNKSAVKDEDLEGVWKALTAIHANTAIVPLHWRVIEPEPGQFDFRVLDSIVNGARRNGLRLVLLWFGTYKNGEMDYTPNWMKADRSTYVRAIGFRGEQLNTMSPLCEAALDADIRAFTAVMRHLSETDRDHRTVIMVQVENEPGLIGTDRDYSDGATRLFESDVPSELMAYLGRRRDDLTASLRSVLSESEFRSSGTWTEVFGDFAAEAFSAWHIARYTDKVAAAGKEVYALPMYANAWVIEPQGERAGRWPSGGPTDHVLDIWKAAAPHLDLIAPDIYYPKFYDDAVPYARPDNPLFVPEVNFMPFFGAHAFMTFATFDGLGIAPYGIDSGVNKQGWEIMAAEFEDTYRVLRPLLPVIARHRYMGKMHAIIQGISPGEDWAHDVHLADETVAALVEFTVQLDVERGRGRGLIIELAPDDYVIAGAGFNVTFRELQGPLQDAQLLSLEEGTFEDGQWVRHRRLNGDELHVRLPDKAKILRVRLARP